MRSEYRNFIALLVIAAAARSLTLQWLHPVTWDEIEFYRATKWVSQGLVPFRDFWEHHTPLQWFVFAPVAALIDQPGVLAIVILRWAQVPIWIVAFWSLMSWMRDAGLSLPSRLSALVLAICSSMFMLAAVEYRIDTLGCALYVIALLCLQRGRGFVAGACLCLAGFANVRLGPLLAATMAMWMWRAAAPGGRPPRAAALRLVAGAATAFAICAAYFFITGSAEIAFQSVWTDNYIGDRLAQGPRWMFVHRIAVPFGIRPLDAIKFAPGSIDVATIAIMLLGLAGLVRALRRRDDFFFLAILQIISIFFVAIMKFIHHYHFEIVILLMLPFVALQLERMDRRAIVAVLALASVVNIYASVLRGKEDDMAYEDFVMKQVDARTSGKVFDGGGRALRREPAYRYWFLPALQTVLEKAGRIAPYTASELLTDPPEAVIADYRVYRYLSAHPELASVVTRHYMPLWRNLWIPAFSSRGSAEWVAPVSGTYRVVASEALARHPWFRRPLEIGAFDSNVAPLDLRAVPSQRIGITVDGAAVGETFAVRRRQTIRVESAVAVMIVPVTEPVFFRQPPRGVTLDAVAPAVTHVPRFP